MIYKQRNLPEFDRKHITMISTKKRDNFPKKKPIYQIYYSSFKSLPLTLKIKWSAIILLYLSLLISYIIHHI